MFHFDRTASCVRQDTQKRKLSNGRMETNNMKRKLIVTLSVTVIVAIALAPAAFAAPANCPLKGAASGNGFLSQILGNSTQPALPDAETLQGMLKGVPGGKASCPKTAALQGLLSGSGTEAAAPASLQQLLDNLGVQRDCQGWQNCQTENCPTGDCANVECTNGDCSTGACSTGDCQSASTCPNK